MSQPKKSVDKVVAEFHKCVKEGSLEEVRQAVKKGGNVNSPGRNGETPLMVAIAAKDLEKMKLLVNNGADPELSDDFNATALRCAVGWDFAAGVEFLLSLGVDRGYKPKYPLKQIDYDYKIFDVPLPDGLKNLMSEEEWKESVKESRAAMIELGKNPTVEPMIADVQSVEVLMLFLGAGDDLNLAPSDVKRSYVGLGNEGDFESSARDYRENRTPRFGSRNPEPMDNPFWRDMIKLGGDAYSARKHFEDTDSLGSAVWCYDRFGSSLTPLDDGRFIQIAGEHEDFYDPDFHIYNDVVVHDGKGKFEVFGYPRDVFPPTDFHTATLVGNSIYIIGCLGYPEQRAIGMTPVYRLAVGTWEIEAVETSGEMPSWLHSHRSTYDAERNTIRSEGGNILVAEQRDESQIIPNEDCFELDLESFRWQKLE